MRVCMNHAPRIYNVYTWLSGDGQTDFSRFESTTHAHFSLLSFSKSTLVSGQSLRVAHLARKSAMKRWFCSYLALTTFWPSRSVMGFKGSSGKGLISRSEERRVGKEC